MTRPAKSLDDELREALQPLAGDPHATARAVLDLLPAAPPRRPVAWLPLLAAAAAGVLVGVLVHAWLAPPRRAVAPAPETVAAELPPAAPPRAVVRAVVGDVRAVGAAGVPEPLLPWAEVAPGFRVETASGALAELLLDDGTLIRLNGDTALSLGRGEELVFVRGQAWLRIGDQVRRVDHGQGRVEVEAAATVDLRGDDAQVAVLAIEGGALLTSRDDVRRRLRERQRFRIVDGIFGNRERLYWVYEETEWQLALLCGERAPEEVDAMVEPMLVMLAMPDVSELAESSLRRMGPCAARPLLEFLATGRDEATTARRRAAVVLRDTAAYTHTDALFECMADRDPEVRVHVYLALRRVTAVDWADEELWRQAPERVRMRELAEWRAALKR